MKKIVFFLLLSILSFASTYKSDKTAIDFSIKKLSSSYEITITAPTDGWVAIGFDGGKIMKDYEVVMLSNDNGSPSIEHFYGVSNFVIKSISSLEKSYKNENLTLKSFVNSQGKSTYVFERSEKVKNSYIKSLEKDKKIKVIVAYSSSTNTSKKHKKADSLEIVLP